MNVKRFIINAVTDIIVGVTLAVGVVGALVLSLKFERHMRGRLSG